MVFSSRENLPRIKDGAYMINIHDKQNKEAHWVSLFIDKNTAVYFDSSEIEYTSQEELSKIKDKSITQRIYRIQSEESVICRFYYIAFLE